MTRVVEGPVTASDRWIETLHEGVHGAVWTSKAELRAVFRTARAEVIAERLDVDVLAQAIDNVTDRTRNAFVGSHVMARYLIEEYLALLPPTEPK